MITLTCRYLGFQLLALVLPHLRAEHVDIAFSPLLVRTLVNNAKRPGTYLHASAKKTMVRVLVILA